jgi:hypothetical protein
VKEDWKPEEFVKVFDISMKDERDTYLNARQICAEEEEDLQ